MNFVKRILRCQIDLDKVQDFRDVTGNALRAWSGKGLRFEILFTRGGDIISTNNLALLTLNVLADSRTGSPFFSGSTNVFDNTVDWTTWNNGTKQHVVFEFSATETRVPANLTGLPYWLFISGTTTDQPDDLDGFGGSELMMVSSGVPIVDNAIQGGNLIPFGAVYTGAGQFSQAVVAGQAYRWTKGSANDTSVTNGTQTVSTTDTIIFAQGSTITLNGTANALITAVVRASPYLTANEVIALINGVQATVVVRIYTGSVSDPNGVVTPTNTGQAAKYYKDDALNLAEWNWSVTNQNWFEVVGG